MYAHMWRMRARKKRTEAYEDFCREKTLPMLKSMEGCLEAYLLKVEAKKPEYIWTVLWKDAESLERARESKPYREQVAQFEKGEFYKTPPVEAWAEVLSTLGGGSEKLAKSRKAEKAEKVEKRAGEPPDEE